MAKTNWSLIEGSLQVINDINPTVIQSGSGTQNESHQISQWYKLLRAIYTIKGKIEGRIATADSDNDTEIVIPYRCDHFYNIITNLVVRLNSNYEAKNITNLSFLQKASLFNDEGYRDLVIIPRSVIIPAGETTAEVEWELNIPLEFTLEGMQGQTRTFLANWLYNAVQTQFRNTVYLNNSSGELQPIDNPVFTQPTEVGQELVLHKATFESSSVNWITGEGVFNAPSASEVLNKLGGIFKVTSFTDELGIGNNQIIDKFTPTTDMTLTSLMIILRDPATGKRVDGQIKRIKFTDGVKPLIDCDPKIIRQLNKTKNKLSLDLFKKDDPNEPDGMGALYGVYKVDSSLYGELGNSALAVGNWTRPKMYLDIDNLNGITAGQKLQIEIYQCFVEVPQMLKEMVNKFVATTQGVQ